MSDLVKRLREGRTRGTDLRWHVTDIHIEAADLIEQLEAALRAHEDHMKKGQHLVIKYLVPTVDPDSIEKDEFVSRIIGHFDGPEQQAVQKTARQALQETDDV